MNNLLLKIFMGINTFLIRASKGKIGGKLGKQTILVMHTIGRRTGKKHRTPISYFTLNNYYYVIGSNWGKDQNAAWYYNLKNEPDVTIDVNGQELRVHSREAESQEYEALWENAIRHYPGYSRYKNIVTRHIPIIVFEVK